MTELTLMYYCESCEYGYRVPKTDPNRNLLTLTMPCPNKECDGGEIEHGDRKEAKKVFTLTAKVLYEACMGMGFPEERLCSPAHLEKLLLGSTILSLDLNPAGDSRSLIESMTITEDDITQHKIFFAMSVKGATIYKTQELADNVQS